MEIDVVRDSICESPFVTLTFNGKSFAFNFGKTPFNSDNASKLINDKWALYHASRSYVARPYTEGVQIESPQKDGEVFCDILSKINEDDHVFSFPLILKPNNGSLGRNVFLARDEDQLSHAIKTIRADKKNGDRLIAQEYLGDEQGAFDEIRAICLDGKSQIVFKRSTKEVIPANIMDPGKWPGLTYSEVNNQETTRQIDQLAGHLYQQHGISYIAFDLKLDRNGTIWLLEGNSAPMGLNHLETELPNGRQQLEKLTDSMLKKISGESFLPAMGTNIHNQSPHI